MLSITLKGQRSVRINEDIFLSCVCLALEMKSKPGTGNLREHIAVNICTVIRTLIQLSNTVGVYKSVLLYMSVIYRKCFRNQEEMYLLHNTKGRSAGPSGGAV